MKKTLLLASVALASLTSAVAAQDLTVCVSWSNFREERWKTDEAAIKGALEFRSVHGVEMSKDGLIYVSDRDQQRVQVFDRMGRYRTQAFVHRNAPSRQTASGLALSPDQRWLYVVDFGNAQLVVFDRKTLKEVATIGSSGKEPGQFIGPHLMATDSKGVLYIAEVQGRRLQRLAR